MKKNMLVGNFRVVEISLRGWEIPFKLCNLLFM
jgi:hypothetical protein